MNPIIIIIIIIINLLSTTEFDVSPGLLFQNNLDWYRQAVACTGLRRGRGRGEMGGGNHDSPSLGVSRFTILSRCFVMLFFLFCKLFEQYSQTNFSIIKTKPFKVTKYNKIKKVWQILGQSG